MTAWLDKGAGSFVLDRAFPGIGRIKRASGTTNRSVFRRLDAMLTALFDGGRLDLLRALRDGTLKPLQLYDAFRSKTLDQLPTGETARPLGLTWLTWVMAKECSIEHKRSLVQSLRHLLNTDVAAPFGDRTLAAVTKRLPRKSVADLPTLLELARRRLATRPRSFNLARSACQAFVRETLRGSHPLWSEITDVRPLKVNPKRAKRPQTVAGLTRILAANAVDNDVRAAAWSMATTGMGPKEYWGRWEREPIGIHIHGTKREGRNRRVPDIGIAVRPSLSRQAFEDRLAEQTGAAITPYDLRRSYSNWLEAAGIIRARRRLYMGHGAKDVSDLYEWHEVQEFLAADAEKFGAWLGEQRSAARLKKVQK